MHGRLTIQVPAALSETPGERFSILCTDRSYCHVLHFRERVKVRGTHEAQPDDPYFHDCIVSAGLDHFHPLHRSPTRQRRGWPVLGSGVRATRYVRSNKFSIAITAERLFVKCCSAAN